MAATNYYWGGNRGTTEFNIIERITPPGTDAVLDYLLSTQGSKQDITIALKQFENVIIKDNWPVAAAGTWFWWMNRGQTEFEVSQGAGPVPLGTQYILSLRMGANFTKQDFMIFLKEVQNRIIKDIWQPA